MDYLLENQETERLLFRKLTPSDFDRWLPYHNEAEAIEFYNRGKAPEVACQSWFDEQFSLYEQQSGGMNALINKKSKALIGQCGLVLHTNNPKETVIRYALLPQFRGNGYAEEALKKCIATAFGPLKLRQLTAMISPSDHEREAVFSAVGMEWDDTDIYNDTIVNIFKLKK